MKPWQVIILLLMTGLSLALFGTVAVLSRSLFVQPDPTQLAQAAAATADASYTIAGTPQPTATPTNTPTAVPTPSPTSTETPIPTATPTRVVNATVTPTASKTPTRTPVVPVVNNTPTPIRRTGTTGGGTNRPGATATPSSAYPFRIIQGPLVYKTNNHFLTILVQVKTGGAIAAGYKLMGTHSPTGFQWESPASCPDLCKASGPEEIYIYDEKGNVTVEKFQVQKGNLVFEAPTYDTGVWSLVLVDAHGQQMSDVFKVTLKVEDKQWFYYELSR